MTTETDAPVAEETKKKLNLSVKVDKKSACQRHVTVAVAREDIDRYMEEAYAELRGKAAVPGFRPGRAPRKLVESRFKDQVKDQVKGSLLMDSMTQINEEQTFTAISEPDFNLDVIQLPDEGPMTFEFNIEVRPEFAMPEWKGLKLDRPVHSFSDDEVTQHLTRLLARYSAQEPVESGVADEDFLTVKLTTTSEGQVVSTSDEVEVRAKPTVSFVDGKIEGFADLVRGKVAGDKVVAQVTVAAESDNEALRGKTVDVEVAVLDVKRLTPPELTPAFLDSIGGFQSEAELRDLVRGEMERQLRFYQQRAIRRQITGVLTAGADWELPQDMLRRQARREMDRAILELRSSGFTDEQIRSHVNELSQNMLQSTATALKEHFILERIAEDEKIEAVPDDYDTEIELIADQSDETPRRVRARLEKRGLMDTLRNQIIERKVIELIESHAEFTESAYEPKKDTVSAVSVSIASAKKDDAEIPEAKHAGGDSEPVPNSPESR